MPSLGCEGLRHGHGMEVPMPLPLALQRKKTTGCAVTPGKFFEIANKSFATFFLSEKWSFPPLIKSQIKFPLAQNSY